MDHVEVLRQVLTRWRERATDNRKKAFRSEHDVTKSDTLDDCADELQDAIAALSAKPEGEAVYQKRGRKIGSDEWGRWTNCDEDSYQLITGRPRIGSFEFEVRVLYTHPPRSHGVVVDEALVDKAGRAFGKANGLSWDEQSIRATLVAALGESRNG